MSHIILVCKSVRFHSKGDEASFFDWIKKVPSITKLEKMDGTVNLHVVSKVPFKDFWGLVGLFSRYNISNMQQLNVLLNKEDKEKLQRTPKGRWPEQLFGHGSRRNLRKINRGLNK